MKKCAIVMISIIACALSISAAGPATLRVVKDPAGLPAPLALFARAGDIVVSGSGTTALVAASERPLWSLINYGHPDVAGYIAALLPDGATARPEAQLGYPVVRVDGKTLSVTTTSVRPEGTAVVIRASTEAPNGSRLEIVVRISFALETGSVRLAAEIRNAGPSRVEGLSFGLGGSAWQSYNFSPFNARAFPDLNVRVYERPDHVLAWHNPNPVETSDRPLPGVLAPGQSHRLTYTVWAGRDVAQVLERVYGSLKLKTVKASLELKNAEGPAEIIVREPASGAVFFRTFLGRPVPLAFPVPPGTYEVRANLFPAIAERTVRATGRAETDSWSIAAPALGRVRVAVADRRGRPVPAKVSFHGLAPTPSPYFTPEDPIASGRSFEAHKNSIYPPKEGREVTLPVGAYLVTSSRGPEYTMDARVVEILAGENPELRLTVERAIETPGLVSIDTHMHTLNSDGYVAAAERLRSAVAEGVDIVVSADHNFVTDYRPEIERLGLGGELAFIAGTEVTARTGSIHFNSLPVAVRDSEPNRGSISVRDETPATLFALAREKNPGTLIHVNHPRSRGLGYFLHYNLDPSEAAFADEPFDTGFDVLEAMNGAKFDEANRATIEDWFHLLNRGHPVRAVGSSDAHGIDGGETGYSRTYVLYDGPFPAGLDEAAVIAAIKKGRAFVSNGPLVAVRANRRATFGDIVKAVRGRVDFDITVAGAPWLDVSEVRLVVNGERRPPLPLKGADGRTVKFRDRVRVELARDSWVAVEVLGRTSLFPLIQQRSGDGRPEEAALPYALTNPIFVDVDGDGRSDPVRPEPVANKR